MILVLGWVHETDMIGQHIQHACKSHKWTALPHTEGCCTNDMGTNNDGRLASIVIQFEKCKLLIYVLQLKLPLVLRSRDVKCEFEVSLKRLRLVHLA